jgi:hypothetical protein
MYVFFYAPCGLLRARHPYISATWYSMRHAACRAPDFHIFLPCVLPCATRLAARQTSIYFCHVFFHAPRGLPRAKLPYISATCPSMRQTSIFLPRMVLFFLGALPMDFRTLSNSHRLKNQERLPRAVFSNAPAVIPRCRAVISFNEDSGCERFSPGSLGREAPAPRGMAFQQPKQYKKFIV